MTAVTISPKFQVVIPKPIRDSLDLHPGQQVEVIQYDGRVEYVPVHALESMRGFLAGIDGFDPRFFAISHREAARMDPQLSIIHI